MCLILRVDFQLMTTVNDILYMQKCNQSSEILVDSNMKIRGYCFKEIAREIPKIAT